MFDEENYRSREESDEGRYNWRVPLAIAVVLVAFKLSDYRDKQSERRISSDRIIKSRYEIPERYKEIEIPSNIKMEDFLPKSIRTPEETEKYRKKIRERLIKKYYKDRGMLETEKVEIDSEKGSKLEDNVTHTSQ